MEELKNELEKNDKIPKERRIRTNETTGKFDDDGFFRTPKGSFWDMDGEYFNHHGFDIHGGKYIDNLDYIPGPTWIEELGCYPEDEEKYKNGNIEDEDDFDDGGEGDKDLEILEKGQEINIGDFKELGITENQFNECFDNKINIKNKKEDKKDKKNKNKNKKKKKKEESFDEDEWEEIED